MKESRGDPCQDSTLLEAEGRMGGGESGLGIFDLLFHLCFVEWLFFGFCELQNFKKTERQAKSKKKKGARKEGNILTVNQTLSGKYNF